MYMYVHYHKVHACTGGESHGGSCYCAMASLVLMNRVEEVLDNGALSALLHWCVTAVLLTLSIEI